MTEWFLLLDCRGQTRLTRTMSRQRKPKEGKERETLLAAADPAGSLLSSLSSFLEVWRGDSVKVLCYIWTKTLYLVP